MLFYITKGGACYHSPYIKSYLYFDHVPPIQARIDLSALERNLHVARRLTSARIMA